MNGICHSWVAGKALNYLPAEAKEYWQDCQALLEDAANFSDIFWPAENSDPKYLAKYPDWRDYVYLPENGELKMGHVMLQPSRSAAQLQEVTAYLLSHILEEMHKGNKERACKFTGILAHAIGEFGQAAHVADPEMLITLFQKDGEAALYHSPMENNPMVTYQEHEYHAQCLGNSDQETTWRFVQRLLRFKDRVLKTIVPIMCATQKYDYAGAAVYAMQNLSDSTDIMSDLLYTLYTLYRGENGADDQLSMVDLVPEGYLCDGCFNFMPYRNVMPGEKWDAPIALDGGEGVQSGVALLPEMFPGHPYPRNAFVSYQVPQQAFRRITFSCGLNHLARVNETSGIFKIFLDDKEVWCSPELSGSDNCVHGTVELGNASHVKFYVEDSRLKPDATKWFYPCFWEMTLHR